MQFPGFQFVSRFVVLVLVTVLAVPSWDAAAALQQTQQEAPPPLTAAQATPKDGTQAALTQVAENRAESTTLLPDAPVPDAPMAQQQPDAQPNPQSNQAQPAQDQQNGNKPVGTAAAPYEKPVGVAAARPAGAAIAPAKQRRVRSFLIRTSLLIGGAVAVGTVVGLSEASPSKPSASAASGASQQRR